MVFPTHVDRVFFSTAIVFCNRGLCILESSVAYWSLLVQNYIRFLLSSDAISVVLIQTNTVTTLSYRFLGIPPYHLHSP